MKKIISFLFLLLMFTCYVKALDGREVINTIEATSNYNMIIAYGENIALPTFNVILEEGINFETTEYGWSKLKNGKWISVRNGYRFNSGTWRYSAKIKLEGEISESLRFGNQTKLIVNGEEWIFSYCSSCAEGNTSVGTIYSPSIVLENDGELQFFESESYHIYTNHRGEAIYSFSVANGVEGGSEPYTFSKISGPNWINVSEEGMISGTPTVIGNNDNLVVRVTDSESNHKDITVIVDKTVLPPGEREVVDEIEITSNINSIPVLGNDIVNPIFTITSTEGSYIEEYNAHWYKLVGSVWKEQTGKFTAGVWEYRTKVSLSGNPAGIYRFDDNTKVYVDGIDYNAEFSGVGNEYYSLSIKSPEFIIKDKIRTIELDGEIKKPVVGDDIIEPTIWLKSVNNNNELINVGEVEAVWQYKTGDNLFDWKDASGKFEIGKIYHIRLLINIESDIYDLENVPTLPVIYEGYNLTQFQLNDKTVGEFIEFDELKEMATPNISIKSDNNKVTLAWEKDKVATKYIVYRSLDNKKFSKVGNVTTNSYIDKGLTYNKRYYYKIKSCNNIRCTSYSNVVSKKIRPNKVTLNIKIAGSNNIKLNWEKVGTTGYEIYRSKDNKKWTKVASITKNSTLEYNNKKLKENKTYYYKVRAYKKVSGKKVYGSYSNVVSTKTAPVKPTLKVTIKNYNSMNITIGSVKGASTYEVQGSLDGKVYSLIEALPTSGVLAQEEHELGVTYYYRVRACNSQNRCSGWVVKSLKQTTKTPSISLKTSSKKVTVKLSSVNGAQGYQIFGSTNKNGKYTLLKEFSSEEELLEYTQKTKKGKTYYYKVRSFALNESVKKVYSPYSSIKSIKSK